MNPIKRLELVRRLKKLGFSGPFSGGKHSFMTRDRLKLRIPNPHKSDIGKELLQELLQQAGVSKEEWDRTI